MLIAEVKRMLKSKTVIISILLGIFVILWNFFNDREILLNLLQNNYIEYIGSVNIYDYFILMKRSGSSVLYLIFMILLSTFAVTDSYKEDIESGFIRNIYTRTKRSEYLISKFFVNYIISFIVTTIPLFFQLVILKFIVPIEKYSKFFISNNYNDMGMKFYENDHLTLYIMLIIAIISLLGATFASIGIVFTTFVKNKYIISIIPFLAYLTIVILSEMLSIIRKYNPFQFLSAIGSGNLVIPIAFCIIVSMLTFVLYYKLGNNYEGI